MCSIIKIEKMFWPQNFFSPVFFENNLTTSLNCPKTLCTKGLKPVRLEPFNLTPTSLASNALYIGLLALSSEVKAQNRKIPLFRKEGLGVIDKIVYLFVFSFIYSTT